MWTESVYFTVSFWGKHVEDEITLFSQKDAQNFPKWISFSVIFYQNWFVTEVQKYFKRTAYSVQLSVIFMFYLVM